jgi:hypothetical protein
VDTHDEVVMRWREPPDPDEPNAAPCPVCGDALPADEEDVRTCEQCGKIYHGWCLDGHEVNVHQEE